jgi:hypothetical protein
MRDLPHDVIIARMQSIQAAAAIWLSRERPIFYKSDVQGYDEALAALIPDVFRTHVFAAIFELCRIDKPKVPGFREIIEPFGFMQLLEEQQATSVEGVMAWLARPEYGSDDLAVWR